MAAQRHSFTALNSTFVVDADYEFVKELGQGAYGYVVATRNSKSGEGCAVKKIANISTKRILTKHCLRELKLLHHFRGHRNIICLYDMDIVFQPNGNFDEVYLYEELMEVDLHAIIRSGQPLTDEHFQSFIYQTLCGLKYIHSAHVLHRDIKPGNLLVNADCELKICDFGLARGYTPGDGISKPASQQGFMTDYVAMRWYRAPEIMLSFANYTAAIDVWSLGCVFAELLGGKPIFKGKDYVDQLNQILHYLGRPSEDTLQRIGSSLTQDYIRGLSSKPPVPFATLYPNASSLAIDLLSQMLCFDPKNRISCEHALNHPYLHVWHDPADEPVCEMTFDFSFEEEDSMEGMKKLITEEVNLFRQEVRTYSTKADPQNRGSDSLTESPSIPSLDESTAPSLDRRPVPPGTNEQIVHLTASESAETHLLDIPCPNTPAVLPNTHGTPSATEQLPECLSSNFNLESPPPPDLTRYIFKSDDQYHAVGGFGDVYKCWYRDGLQKEVAVKALRFGLAVDEDPNSSAFKMLRRELGIWRRLSHVNIVPFLGIAYGFGMRGSMSLVSSWMPNGPLHTFLEKHNDGLVSGHRLQFLLDIANGLHYLHSIPVVHGDLNCNNVLLDADYRARLVDFGYASLMGNFPEALNYLQRSTVRPGSLRWSAPEQIEEEYTRTPKSDIYSFGCVGLQVLSGKQPWSEVKEDVAVVLRLSKGHKPSRPTSRRVDDAHWDLIQRCWSSTEERPSAGIVIRAIQGFLDSVPQPQPLHDLISRSF